MCMLYAIKSTQTCPIPPLSISHPIPPQGPDSSGLLWIGCIPRMVFFDTPMASQWILVDSLLGKLPSGKHTKNYGKSPFSIGKSTINCHFQ